ncbi:MAG: DUF5713 family protein [Acidaminococcales bacterium]|jgi:hypothetical protein|nr:DUF5713 family protein [Acidaminococcales bacterium]
MKRTLEKFNADYILLAQMYEDAYYPKFLVDKLRFVILDFVGYLADASRSRKEIQEKLDEMNIMIGSLREEFHENGSEFETVARACVAADIEYILKYFSVGIELAEALRARDW